jgi:tellurite resistance protein
MKKVKHSKVKNTGVLFELLVRQITLEVLNGDKTENAKKIVREFFAPGKELNKELRLYELLLKEKYSSEVRAEKFVDTVCEAYSKIDDGKLNKEKYNLIKAIKESFDVEQFLSSPISNYKVLASIYKVFEARKVDGYDIKDAFNSKITLIENITSKPVQKDSSKNEVDTLVEMYKKEDKDIRLLTYKILIETFNKKYTNLDTKQKTVLREYINNINNTSKFKEYFSEEITKTISELNKVGKKICDKVTSIKLNETISVLKSQKMGRTISDNQVAVLLLSQELLKELKSKIK